MAGANDGEVAPIEGRDGADAQAFGQRDDGCVRGAEGHVEVAAGQLGDAGEVWAAQFGEAKAAGGKVLEEPDLGVGASLGLQQIGGLRDDGGGDEALAGRDRAQELAQARWSSSAARAATAILIASQASSASGCRSVAAPSSRRQYRSIMVDR